MSFAMSIFVKKGSHQKARDHRDAAQLQFIHDSSVEKRCVKGPHIRESNLKT
jgi:hypothetical protein